MSIRYRATVDGCLVLRAEDLDRLVFGPPLDLDEADQLDRMILAALDKRVTWSGQEAPDNVVDLGDYRRRKHSHARGRARAAR